MKITEIQRFCMRDGPGLRTVVFMKGCPLDCAWCHNPETKKFQKEWLFYREKCIGCNACENRTRPEACPVGAMESAGKEMSVDEILEVVLRDQAFYGSEGGITLSGGEPMAQPIEALALMKAAKEQGLSVAVETCGLFASEYCAPLAESADLLLFDVKDTDAARHKAYTGQSNEKILANLRALDALGVPTVLRCILVAGVNTSQEHYRAVADLFGSLRNCRGVELLPYHPYGLGKLQALTGQKAKEPHWIPSAQMLAEAREVLKGCLLG